MKHPHTRERNPGQQEWGQGTGRMEPSRLSGKAAMERVQNSGKVRGKT